MIENYCYGDDGYSMQQEGYHAMQNDYNNNHSSMQMMKPSSHYSNQNMKMHSESYGSHPHGFPGNKKYQSGYSGHNMYQNGHSGSAASNGFHMSHTSMGTKPISHHSMNASHLSHTGGSVGGGGYNSMMMSSTEYDNYNKVRPAPVRMQTAAMGYENRKWGGSGYHYNQSMNCMPSNGHNSSQWISKGLDD